MLYVFPCLEGFPSDFFKAAQAGIAMLNLTYGFEVNTDAVLLNGKNITLANMEHFWPQGTNTIPTLSDEEFIAHS